MKLLLLIFLFFPLFIIAQTVRPVLSSDYLALIHKDRVPAFKQLTDSSNSMKNASLHYSSYNFSGQFVVKRIIIKPDQTIELKPINQKYIGISGAVTSTMEWQFTNRLPALQNEYVQGRSSGGSSAWQGPETGELFSYGPSIYSLEFDGTNYDYDLNGRLVKNGTGNGKQAIAYNNSIFRTGSLFSRDVMINTRYRKYGQQLISATVKLGNASDQTVIESNKNKENSFSASVEAGAHKLRLQANYIFRRDEFSNSNRTGFLNRVFQNSLLSPVSFENNQGNFTVGGQRSYSAQADNPFFLLNNEDHFSSQQDQSANLSIEHRSQYLDIKLSQSMERSLHRAAEGYQPGTAFFANGIFLDRSTFDRNYLLNLNATYTIPFDSYHFKAKGIANYIYKDNHSSIDYYPEHNFYRYQRNSNQVSLSFSPEFDGNNFGSGLLMTENIYTSNTASANAFFLPAVSGFLRLDPLFGKFVSVKLIGSFTRFDNELPIDQSLAASSLTAYSVTNALQWLPAIEVNSFNKLKPIEHREWTAGMEWGFFKNKVMIYSSWFSRHTTNDVFPIMNGSQMELVNMASHRTDGFDMQLCLYPTYQGGNRLFFNNTINFISYRSKVTDVYDGYNFTPVSGFRDIYKGIVQGEPLGVIVGNSWLRDGNSNRIIGADGFPLVNNKQTVIGNPIPEFVFKMDHRLSYKRWALDINWEWRKGGDVWNGTRAALDYYGRSAGSAAERNLTNYIFNGVSVNGNPNTIPVSFYNASQPIEQNRWVRYGESGVAEDYIEKGDCIRLRTMGISYTRTMKKYLQQIIITLYTNNIVLWSRYKGVDPEQSLNDQPGSSGLDFFNLPSTHSIGFSVSLQF